MKTLLFSMLAVVGVFAVGCRTPYQASGWLGGYSETAFASDVWRIRFAGNGYTSPERAADYLLLRAAELTITNGFDYFAVLHANERISHSTFTTGGYASTTTSGSVSSYGNFNAQSSTVYSAPQTHDVYKPIEEIVIKFLPAIPTNQTYFEARFIMHSLQTTYHLHDH